MVYSFYHITDIFSTSARNLLPSYGFSAILTAASITEKRGQHAVPELYAHGAIAPRLKDLIDEARRFWGIRVTLQMLSSTTGLNIKILRAYYRGETSTYTLGTVGKLSWFFQCPTDCVITWHSPGEQRLPPVRVGPIQFPHTMPPAHALIRNRIPAKLADIPFAEVKAGTGLSRNAVRALQNQGTPPERIRGRTLAAICDFLSQREGRRIPLTELLPGVEHGATQEESGRKEG
jgi:hypothetical protein